jgi:hypothetical protein
MKNKSRAFSTKVTDYKLAVEIRRHRDKIKMY